MTAQILTQERLKELLHYNPDTGIFTWISNSGSGRGNTYKKIAGNMRPDGYRGICVEGKTYLSARLSYFYMTGSWPDEFIDHLNHERDDNRWCNLRAVSGHENRINKKLKKDNKSGIHGVYYVERDGRLPKWVARIKAAETLGQFDTLFDACCARKSAEHKLGYHVNHGK